VQEQAHASKQEMGLPSFSTWELVLKMKPQWEKNCNDTFTPNSMMACANCGFTSIGGPSKFVARPHTHWPKRKKTPAAFAYPHLLEVRVE